MKVLYSKDKAPSAVVISSPEWRNLQSANYCFFGDSNAHLTNVVKMIGEYCGNDAYAGSVPGHTLGRLETWSHCSRTLSGVYIQTGGNRWGGEWQESVYIDIHEYIREMDEIINLAHSICTGTIIIASLPYIAPWVTVSDWPTTSLYPVKLRAMLARVNANDLFELANKQLEKLCESRGVVYYDIFNRLKMFWKAGYSRHLFYDRQSLWFDEIHYGNEIRFLICQDVKRLWGI